MKDETIEDILREMCTITFGEECCPDCGADFQRSNRWPEFADRIEAAWKRESNGHTDYLDDPEVVDKMKFIVAEYVLCDENILTDSAKRLRETARSAVIAMYNHIRDYESGKRADN